MSESSIVIIPARNEETTIGAVVREISAQACDVVVVDDCSSDTTQMRARAAGAVVIPLAIRLGAWGAIQAGMRYALGHGYQTVITMDADGQHLPCFIPDILKPVQNGASDVVIGAFPSRGSSQRRLAWQFFKLLTGLSIADITSGFRAYNYKAFSMLASKDATLLDYQDIGVLLLLQKAGLRVMEIQTNMQPRINGYSRIYSSWWKVFLYLLESTVLSVSRRNMPVIKKKGKPS